jgi:hypothetical protein
MDSPALNIGVSCRGSLENKKDGLWRLICPGGQGKMAAPEQNYWWGVALELKLRKCSGDAFQEFFSVVMAKVHGSDFVRVRPFGALGDKGCDGYLQPSGQVFACYGALNGDGGKVAYLIGKMGTDYAKAAAALSMIMKEWHMVHNLVDGLPVEANLKLEELRQANPARTFGFIGLEGFHERILGLAQSDIEDLLGPVATSRDAQNMQVAELRDLVAHVAAAAGEINFDVTTIAPVPPDKLTFNNLPGYWRALIAGGWQNAHLVGAYLDRHNDPLIGEKIAQVFRERYGYLKNQHLTPANIMASLYDMVAGVAGISAQRAVAAQALLAYLFESCDIFESQPAATAS